MINMLKKMMVTGLLMGCIALSGFGVFGAAVEVAQAGDASPAQVIHSYETINQNEQTLYEQLAKTEEYANSLADVAQKTLRRKQEAKHFQSILPKAAAGTYTSEAGATPPIDEYVSLTMCG